jgi:hypothetical protein
MGYDIHITRKELWSDEDGPTISEDEWRKFIETDPDLELDSEASNTRDQMFFATYRRDQTVFGWMDGDIFTKNPERDVIQKAVQIAERLGAKVQGDDGEVYGPSGEPIREEAVHQSPPRPGLLSRIADWFRHQRTVRRVQETAKELRQTAPPFKVGDRVRDIWGAEGTVLEVDGKANYGIGRMRVRLDDGREAITGLVGSRFEIVKDPTSG